VATCVAHLEASSRHELEGHPCAAVWQQKGKRRPNLSAFKQPISRAKIDLLFDADKRGLVVKLRDLNLAEEFAWGPDGHLRFTTASLSGSQAATQPFDNREATSFRLGRAIWTFLNSLGYLRLCHNPVASLMN
jgi:hypothetical protein